MLADPSRSEAVHNTLSNTIQKLDQTRQQLQTNLLQLEEQSSKLTGQEETIEAQARSVETLIRQLAEEEALLLQRKRALQEQARTVGEQRARLIQNRQELANQQQAIHARILQLDQDRARAQQQKMYEEAERQKAQQAASMQKQVLQQTPQETTGRDKPKPYTPPATRDDGRIYPRIAINADVTLNTETNFFTGMLENISEGGLFIATYEHLPVGTKLEINLRLPNSDPFDVKAIVRWVREYTQFTKDVSPGVGVQFAELMPQHRQQIERFIQLRSPLLYEFE